MTTDGSVGAAGTLTGPNYAIPQTLGTTVGNNLFHSFGTFDLSQGDVATFTGANTLQNVISRVTGGSASSIDGTLQSQIGQANFFFLNPAGVIFGEHAAVDVPAGFHVSTAQELRFADGAVYSAAMPAGSSLTAAAPEAFGFLGRTGDIRIENGQLHFQEGTAVTLTGGAVVSNGATLEIPEGSLRVYGQGDTVGAISIQGDLPAGNGAVTVNDGRWDTSGDDAGTLEISGGEVSIISGADIRNDNLSLQDAAGALRIDANMLLIDNVIIEGGAQSSGDAATVAINVSGEMRVLKGGQISSNTYAQGDAGTITVEARGLILDGQGTDRFTGIFSEAGSDSTGKAGYIAIHVSGEMQVLKGGQISSGTYAQGDAGGVAVTVQHLIIDGQKFTAWPSGIFSEAAPGSTGKAGSVVINVGGEMRLLDGGVISSDTWGSGDAGSVTMTAGSLILDQQGSEGFTGIDSTAEPGSTGTAGSVVIDVGGEMQVLNGGVISSDTWGSGDAGSVTMTAGSLILDRQGSEGFTGIDSTAEPGSTGKAGRVVIGVGGEMRVLNGGEVSSSALAQGDAGGVDVTAGSLTIDGQDSERVTGIASTAESGSTGKAGSVVIDVGGEMRVLNGGVISSDTWGSGDAGSVTMTAGSLILDRQGSNGFTGIDSTAEPGSTGKAGSVVIDVGGEMWVLNGGVVASSTLAQGDAGSVTVIAESLVLDGQGSKGLTTEIASQADPGSTGKAGNIIITISGDMQVLNAGKVSSGNYGTQDAGTVNLSVGGLLNLTDGVIETIAQTGHGGPIHIRAPVLALINGQITTSVAGEQGNGGDITVSGDYLVMDTGFIQANTAAQGAQGGNIRIDVAGILVDANSGGVAVGGQTRETFVANSGRNVIQAAAPDGVSGEVRLSSPPDASTAAGLVAVASYLFDPGRVAGTPCAERRRRGSLYLKGRGGLPATALDTPTVAGAPTAPGHGACSAR